MRIQRPILSWGDVINEPYFYVESDGLVRESFNTESLTDRRRFDVRNYFVTEEDAIRHAEMLQAVRNALAELEVGRPISIDAVKPLLMQGHVAMDKNGTWCWFSEVPDQRNDKGFWELSHDSKNGRWFQLSIVFNIQPAQNWQYSLQECGL